MRVLPEIVYQGYTWQAHTPIAIHHVVDKKPLAGWCHHCTGNGRNPRYWSPTYVGISGPFNNRQRSNNVRTCFQVGICVVHAW